MTAIITAITSFVTAAIGWMTSYVASITASGNEILLLAVVCVPLVGLGAGLVRQNSRPIRRTWSTCDS